MIERAKADRAIILTTHSMEEADALCSRIGIMAGGELRCIGSQLHLKNKFGSGYRLKLQLAQPDAQGRGGASSEEIGEFVTSRISAAAQLVTDRHHAGAQIYSLPKASVAVSAIFRLMEQARALIGTPAAPHARADGACRPLARQSSARTRARMHRHTRPRMSLYAPTHAPQATPLSPTAPPCHPPRRACRTSSGCA